MRRRFTTDIRSSTAGRRGKLGVVAAAACALALAACGSTPTASSTSSGKAASGTSTPKSMTTINLAGAGTPNGVDANVAYCKYSGICAKYGINLKIVYPASGGTSSDAAGIANNTFQVAAISGPAMVKEYEAGVKLTAVANSYSKSLLGLSVRAQGSDANITAPAQLKGKTIGVSEGSGSGQVLAAYLQYYGLSPSQYSTQTMALSALVSSFTLGKVDAAVVYPMDTSPQFNASGVKTKDFYFATDPALTYLYDAWVMSPTWISAHPQATKDFVAALNAATKGAVANPDTAAADLVKSAPHTAPSLAVTTAQWKGNIPFLQSSADSGHSYVYMASADWNAALKYAEGYLKAKPMDTSLLYTNQYDPAS